jgi:zinc transport system substrate-binding protein
MLKNFFKLSFLASLIIILSACSSTPIVEVENEPEEKLVVAATIFPIYDLVKEVGGDKVEAYLILKPGASPHTFESLPSQVKALQSASLFFYNGLMLDDWAKDIGRDSSTQLVDLSHYVELKGFEEENDHHHDKEEEEDHNHGDIDPHYWLSPANAKYMVEAIANYLSQQDEENSLYYQNRAQDYIITLEEKALQWQEKITGLEKRDLVVFHGAWNYFADYFGLNIVASFEPFPGQTPSPQYIIELENVIKEHNINTIFIEPQLSQEAVMSLANDLAVEIKTLDPLGGVDSRLNYINLIDYNINTIYQALNN